MSLAPRRDLAIILVVVAGSTVTLLAFFRLRDWYHRNLSRAPSAAHLGLILTLLVGVLLVAAHVVPLQTAAVFIMGLSVLAAIWGWLRYRRPGHFRRWEATYQQIEKLLDSNRDAADALMMEALRQDDAERQQLRAAAPTDRRAALEFQRRTNEELRAVARSAALEARARNYPSDGPTGAAVVSRRRQRLEADRDWIRAILSRSGGAA